MAKGPKAGNQKDKSGQSSTVGMRAARIASTQPVKKELSMLEKLSAWHKRSDKTRWVIGEYLTS